MVHASSRKLLLNGTRTKMPSCQMQQMLLLQQMVSTLVFQPDSFRLFKVDWYNQLWSSSWQNCQTSQTLWSWYAYQIKFFKVQVHITHAVVLTLRKNFRKQFHVRQQWCWKHIMNGPARLSQNFCNRPLMRFISFASNIGPAAAVLAGPVSEWILYPSEYRTPRTLFTSE